MCRRLPPLLRWPKSPSTTWTIQMQATHCSIIECNEIRLQAYSAISRIVDEALSIRFAVEINSKRSRKANFLLLGKVFYQLVTFGVFDKCEQIKQLSEAVLSHLLQCELLVSEEFRQRLVQLISVYMPFIQCLASQSSPLGQCILKMSDDLLTPTMNETFAEEHGLKLMLNSPVERLRSSLRYLYSSDKNLRKKGYQQAVGFLVKYHSHNSIESDATFIDRMSKPHMLVKLDTGPFNLSDFYLRFSPDKYADMAIKLRRKNRLFTSTEHDNLCHVENLVKIYNIFTSDTVDVDVKQNAAEQLSIMIATGHRALHKAFISMDGLNYCIRYLRQSLLDNTDGMSRKYLFLAAIDHEALNRIRDG